MEAFIAILRGINVSGHKKILMADLKALFEELQFLEVQTYIQSGNVVFKSPQKISDLKLAATIEKALLKRYGFEVPVIARTREALQKVILSNPFATEKGMDLKKLHVTFLSEVPAKEKVEAVNKSEPAADRFLIGSREIYLHTPGGYGNTKLSNTFFEKKLQVTATTRNWNTVITLAEMAS